MRATQEARDVSAGGLRRLLDALPSAPKARGDAFERLCKWFLLNDPVYASRLRKVWLWSEWPGRWGVDAGIDLVAETRDGRLWAIQAKAYSEQRAVTKRDLDTFLSESSRRQFSYRLLIATTDQIGSTALRTIRDQRVEVGTCMLGDLYNSSVAWPSSLNKLGPTRRLRKKPRPHQRSACRDVVQGLQTHDRGQLIMACGTGKTLTSLFIAEKLQAKSVLYLVPSLSLLAQTIQAWLSSSSRPLNFVVVCSDDSVVEQDELVETVSELGLPVTTDAKDVAAFLKTPSRDCKVVFSTYHSSPVVSKAQQLVGGRSFDLVVADEAHRLVGRPSDAFLTVLSQTKIRAKKRLFMTATPKVATARLARAAAEADLEIASMDEDSEHFGLRLHTLTFGEAIRRGLLTDYRVAVVAVDDAQHAEWISEGRILKGTGLEDISARTLAAHVGLAKAIRKFDIRRAISFHGVVRSANKFAGTHSAVVKWLPAKDRPRGSIHADFISGQMSAGERRRRLEVFANPPADRALLSNARCLTEGIDVPALDGVAFIEPRRSEIDVVQAVGRAIRLSPDKRAGTIVIPVFVGPQEDSEASLNRSAFKPVWDVLTALRSHDAELASQLDGLRRQLGRTPKGSLRLPPKIHLDLPTWVTPAFGRSIRSQIVERTTSRWEYMFGLLEAFVSEHGHALVPDGYVASSGEKLGDWVRNQRSARGRLLEDRQALLEGLPGWSWSLTGDAWERAFQLLEGFVEREGHARVPARWSEAGFPLGTWIAAQRTKRRNMSAARRDRLEALPDWAWQVKDAAWEEAYQALRTFALREGHIRVPRNLTDGKRNLSSWVIIQRQHAESMDSERRKKLEALPGWAWDPFESLWESGYNALLRFVAREGHAVVPQRHVEGGHRLGSWVLSQRQAKDMPASRREKLEALPGWVWSAKEAKWEEGFAALSRYVDRHGTARVPKPCVEDGFALGAWVATQRRNRTSMPDGHRKRLEALKGWAWNRHVAVWQEGYDVLREYLQRVGHAAPGGAELEGDFPVGAWVMQQRSSRNRMPADRKKKLEALTGWTWDARRTTPWDTAYETLRQFIAREGHARVPQNYVEKGVRLGHWISRQRKNQAALPAALRAKLEELPGWTWSVYDSEWDLKFALLCDYVARKGTARVPQLYVTDGVRLGAWVGTQRQRRKTLEPRKRKMLEDLPGWVWSTRGPKKG